MPIQRLGDGAPVAEIPEHLRRLVAAADAEQRVGRAPLGRWDRLLVLKASRLDRLQRRGGDGHVAPAHFICF